MNSQYEIVVSGHLSSKWAAVFEGMQVICQPGGNTLITGALRSYENASLCSQAAGMGS
jgi:hypothetical protein